VLVLVVWLVTGLVVLLVLGSVLFGVAGSLRRLARELGALERELEPVRTQVRATAERAATAGERPGDRR
jgi:hypothetical protein